jgi:hypothetical protein
LRHKGAEIKTTTFILFSFLLLLSSSNVHAQSSSTTTTAVTININSTVFMPNSMLVIYGKVIPNDSLIVELINPMNRIVHRTQIDVDARGVFSSVILTFPNPNDQFIEGTYTLVITSSIQGSVYSKAIVFQASSNEIRVQQGDALQQQQQQQQITRRLDMQLSAPSIIGIDERFSIVARVTMDNTLFNVNASDIKARIIMPDSSAKELRFNAIDDGIYATELTLSMVGLHVVTASIEHDGLKASSMASINVTDAPVLNMSNTLSRLSKSIDDLNSSIQGLRNDINASNSRLSNSLEQIGSSTNQMLALLLPIIGMITIIVALQATILAKRSTARSTS